jgi:hypothetical protein
MPFIDRIATRALFVFVATMALALAFACVVLGVSLVTGSTIPSWAVYTLITLALISLVSFGNFVTLFVVFSQSRAVSLSNLEERLDG